MTVKRPNGPIPIYPGGSADDPDRTCGRSPTAADAGQSQHTVRARAFPSKGTPPRWAQQTGQYEFHKPEAAKERRVSATVEFLTPLGRQRRHSRTLRRSSVALSLEVADVGMVDQPVDDGGADPVSVWWSPCGHRSRIKARHSTCCLNGNVRVCPVSAHVRHPATSAKSMDAGGRIPPRGTAPGLAVVLETHRGRWCPSSVREKTENDGI